MTSIERVQRTIRHETTDRLPYCITMVGSAWQKLSLTLSRKRDGESGKKTLVPAYVSVGRTSAGIYAVV